MATPLNADQLLRALRDKGLRVVEHRNWRTHNRNHKGPWGPVHGVMLHHTVSSGTASSVELCYNGHASLPGPLCHGVIDKAGTIHLVGNGRTNHAGSGDGDVLRAVINETTLPPDNEANTDGNRHFYGFECINLGDGNDPWPAAQIDAMVKAAAAICETHGWSERSVIAHAEWQPGKIDPLGPGYPGHDHMRALVGFQIGRPTGSTPPEEDDMAEETERKIASLHSNLLRIGSLTEKEPNGQREVHGAGYYLAHIERDTTTLQQQVADLTAKVDALTTTGLTQAQIKAVATEVSHLVVPTVLDTLAKRMQA
jgi:hypothetical protein